LSTELTLRLPEITFTDSLTLYLGDHAFELIHLPGHAPGVIGVFIPQERTVFVSDCIFCKSKSYLHEATPDKWLESLKKLGELDVDFIVPGHGEGVCDKQYLMVQARTIEQWVEIATLAINQGLTVEEVAAKLSCPDPYPLPPSAPMKESDLNKAILTRLYRGIRGLRVRGISAENIPRHNIVPAIVPVLLSKRTFLSHIFIGGDKK
jgi:glyoxylase-like metal-dependent hydrolase (beta-lactamase superfamily II)